MLTVKMFTFNPIQTNTFILSDESKECVIIDPACYFAEEENEISSYVSVNNLKPVHLINTHGHIDHILGIVFISKKFSLTPQIHASDMDLVKLAPQYASMFGLECSEWPESFTYFKDNDSVLFGNSELKIIHTPGHSGGSVCFYYESEKQLFAGDTLFSGSIGRTDLPGGDYDAIMKSIKTKLFMLPNEVKVHSGHGIATTIGYEKRSNPFLQ